MDKRYQVFVSSTYADLKQERQRVIQALMEMDCIPAGMELFPAADEEQWAFIKSIIEDCDYYLIIIGGRYGSTMPDGVSYTEKEFDYANERGIKVIALLHEDPDSIPVGKSDIEPSVRAKLEAFRDKVASNRLVKFWKIAEELPGLVALSLSKTIKTHPAVGWVRASGAASESLLLEINELRKENSELRKSLERVQPTAAPTLPDLADIDSSIETSGRYHVDDRIYKWNLTVTWRKLFSLIAPYLMDHPNDGSVNSKLAEVLANTEKAGRGWGYSIEDQLFKTISIQLKALGLVNIECSKAGSGAMLLFWSLTPAGEQLMVRERTIKKGATA